MRRSQGVGRGPALTLLGVWAMMFLGPGPAIKDGDTPWHVAHGLLMLERGAWMGPLREDPFSWTAGGEPWQPNGWGFDLLSAAAWQVGGWAGLSLLRGALLALVVALLWRTVRSFDPWPRVGAVAVVAALALPADELRPQLLSFAAVLLLVELVPRALRGDRTGWVGTAVVTLVWSNVHGVAVLAVLLTGALALGVAIRSRSVARAALLVLMVGALSTANPFGLDVWSYAFETREASIIIEEWRPASLGSARDVLVIGVGLLCLLWGLRSWRRQLPTLILLGGMVVLSLDAVRNESIMALVAAPLVASMLTALGRRRQLVRPGALALVAAGSVAAASLTGPGGGGAFDIRSPRPDVFPVGVAGAIDPSCRLLNEYTAGGYLVLVRPDVPVSQDGRNDLYGVERILAQDRALEGGVEGLDEIGVDCVLTSHERDVVEALEADGAWVRVASDQATELWERRSLAQ